MEVLLWVPPRFSDRELWVIYLVGQTKGRVTPIDSLDWNFPSRTYTCPPIVTTLLRRFGFNRSEFSIVLTSARAITDTQNS